MLVTPPLETPDAYYQFGMIEYIDRTDSFPRPSTIEQAHDERYKHVVYHAPLYYLLSSIIIRAIDTSDFMDRFRRNPHAQIGEPSAVNNHNFTVYFGTLSSNSGLAMQVVRLWSVSLGLITIIAVYSLANILLPARHDVALTAVAVIVFNPQFLFISSSINNDNLVIAISSVIIYFIVLCVRREMTWKIITILSILLALNSLSKASGLVLYPVVIITALYLWWRDRINYRRIMLYALIGIVAFIFIAGWWYLDNWTRYGDFTASSWVARAATLRSGTIDWVSELRGVYLSFWGLFGWFNIPSPDVFYIWTLLLITLSTVGVWFSWRRLDRDSIFIVFIAITYGILFFLSWANFNAQVMAGQGRLFFPLISLIACFIGLGLSHWRWGRLMLLPMFIACIALPLLVIQPIYRAQSSIPKVNWDASLETTHYALIREPWSEEACLRMWITNIQANNDQVTLDLTWEPICSISGFWSVFVHYVDPTKENCVDNFHVISQNDTMPDGGRKPFPSMQVNYVLSEQIHVDIPNNSSLADTAIHIGLYDAGGTFIRAFVDSYSSDIVVGSCAPELIVLNLN